MSASRLLHGRNDTKTGPRLGRSRHLVPLATILSTPFGRAFAEGVAQMGLGQDLLDAEGSIDRGG